MPVVEHWLRDVTPVMSTQPLNYNLNDTSFKQSLSDTSLNKLYLVVNYSVKLKMCMQ